MIAPLVIWLPGLYRSSFSQQDQAAGYSHGSPDAFVARLAYDLHAVDEELALIEVVRSQMARVLRSLKPEDFQRTGIHSVRGPVPLEEPLQQITEHIPRHLAMVEQKKGMVV
jgi:hypothetical protein